MLLRFRLDCEPRHDLNQVTISPAQRLTVGGQTVVGGRLSGDFFARGVCLDAEGVDFRAHQLGERGVDRLMAAAQRESPKTFCHDPNPIVPAAADRAWMPGMRRAVVDDVEALGLEPLLEAFANPGDTRLAHRAPDSSAESGSEGVLRMAIQMPCAIENASVRPSPPNSLNFTQNASLKL